MGAGLSNSLKPEELHEFRKLNPERTAVTVNIPARPEDRTATDKKFLIVFIAAIILLLPFLIYCWSYSDIRRITTWTDTCGNFCGHKNKHVDGIECSGYDFTNQPILQFSQPVNFTLKRWYLYDRKCVSSCDDSYKVDRNLGICYPSWAVSDVSKNYFTVKFIRNLSLTETQLEWWKFIFTILIGISLTLTFMYLLRYIPTIVVWTCLMLNISLFAGGAIAIWYYYATSKDIIPEEQKTYKDAAITFTALAVLLVILLSSMFKRIGLVVLLMKETTKAIFDMPLLLTVPMLTFIIQLIAVAVLGVNFVFLLSYGTLKEIPKTGFYVYYQDPLWIFTLFYNTFVTICILDFIGGCHFIIIAGAVSSWYFAKNNRYLRSPIWNSVKLLFRFHLGTVALGSLVITLVKMIRILISSFARSDKMRAVIENCLKCIEGCVKFLTKNAYIVTAIHGQSFYKSGHRAARLLLSNIVDLAAVTSVSSFVLEITQWLIICIGTGLSYFIFSHDKAATSISFVILSVIVAMLFSVFTSIIDTLFICFCEDCSINDGMARPYYMSKGLMEFIEESKRVIGENKTTETPGTTETSNH